MRAKDTEHSQLNLLVAVQRGREVLAPALYPFQQLWRCPNSFTGNAATKAILWPRVNGNSQNAFESIQFSVYKIMSRPAQETSAMKSPPAVPPNGIDYCVPSFTSSPFSRARSYIRRNHHAATTR